MPQDRKFKLDDISRGIAQGLTRGDEERVVQFERLQFVRNAKATSLQREHKRLSEKYDNEHPRVAELANKSVANLDFLRDVVAETIRAKTEIPVVDAQTWVLHGYVRDKDGAGLSHLTVALYDRSGDWLQEMGHACTAVNGYFKIETTGDLLRRDISVFIRVLNNQAQHLYAAKDPLKPKPGRVDYREIVLDGDVEICAPPTQSPKDPPPDPHAWVVRGRVTDPRGQGLEGLTVTLYDKDLFFHDRLGQAETDAQGNYSFTYKTSDFRDLIEKKPDLFIKVLNRQGETLHSSKSEVRYESGRVEIINIRIDS